MRHRGGRAPTILMTADAVGGVWTYALSLCAALPQYRFVLAVMGPPLNESQRDAARAVRNITLEQRDYRLEWMQGATADLASSRRWLAGLAVRHGAALIHCNGYAHAQTEAHSPIVAVAHSDVLSWRSSVCREPAPNSWDSYRREVIAGLAAADCVVAPSRAVLDDLSRHYGFANPRAIVIPNGIDLDAFSPRPKRQVVMAAGRLWDKAKNTALLDDIAGDLDWPVEIAGETAHPEAGSVRLSAARPLGLLTRAEMAERLGAAAIFAAPARYEPFGLGILEAAASGCALALGDIPSLRENWDGAALFVSPDDPAAWRNGLCELIADAALRQHLAAAARDRAANFPRRMMAVRYAALYRELVSRAERREVA
jgi:glycosyltransferase involved in cell wall biosynthesis